MLNTKELRVRLTAEEYSRIKTKAQLQGFNTLSAYIRDKLLKINFQTKKKLAEIHKVLKRREI